MKLEITLKTYSYAHLDCFDNYLFIVSTTDFYPYNFSHSKREPPIGLAA